jgi:glycosyltransferase involved in cell wall biosynthesis
MKILISIHHFPPKYTGGAEWRAFRTAQALISRGHQVKVICIEDIDQKSDNGISWNDNLFAGVPIRRLSFDLKSAPDPFRWTYDNPWIGEHLSKLMKEMQPDLYHMIGGYLLTASALQAAHKINMPTVITLTDFWFLCPRIQMVRSNNKVSTLPIQPETCARCLAEENRRFRIPGKYLSPVMSVFWKLRKKDRLRLESRKNVLLTALNKTNKIVCPSRFLLEIFAKSGVDKSRLVYSRQGYVLPGEVKKTDKVKPPGQGLHIGYLGQISHIKGIHILIEAISLLRENDVKLKIYGDQNFYPKYTARLKKIIAKDQRIKIEGTFQRIDLLNVLNELDVIVVPSLWYENSPNVILEAFAHRIPVIASNSGGMAELVEHERNGLLFEMGNPDDLARQINRLIEDPGLLKQLQIGISPVKSVEEEIDELEEIYKDLTRP